MKKRALTVHLSLTKKEIEAVSLWFDMPSQGITPPELGHVIFDAFNHAVVMEQIADNPKTKRAVARAQREAARALLRP